MPIRFSTEAANADTLDEDTQASGTPEARPRAQAARRKPADRFERPARRERKADDATAGVKPGKDINAAGFIKDQEPKP